MGHVVGRISGARTPTSRQRNQRQGGREEEKKKRKTTVVAFGSTQ